MKKSCAVIGVVFLLLLVAGIGTLAMKAPAWWAKGTKFFQEAMTEQRRIEEIERNWTPPSETPDASWAPAALGEWKLKQMESVSGWPDLKVPRPGLRVVYEKGGRQVEIGVVAANDLEKEVLIERILEAAQNGGSGHMISTMGNQTQVKTGSHHTRVWWIKNRLFFFRSQAVDPDFAETYLNTISGTRKAEKE